MVMMPTPYSIMNDPDDGEDVFDTIFSGDALKSEKCAVMWAIYHDTGIGNADKAYWERAMIFKNLELAAAGWDTRIAAQIDLMTDISNDGPDYTQSKITSGSVNRRYDPPEVVTSGSAATDYLADQDTTDFNQSTESGLQTETVRAWTEAMPDDLRTWAFEFRKLFYWGL